MAHRMIPLVLLVPLLALAAAPRPSIDVAEAEAILYYPDSIDFTLHAASSSAIVLAEVEYGLEISSCGTDVNRAQPEDFEPASIVDTLWTWDMRQTGSLPPGAQLWWRWHLVDASGGEHRTPTQTITWLDDVHPWQTRRESNLSLHTYNASADMQRQLLQAAVNGATRLRDELGPLPIEDVHLYIYDSTEAMRQAILFEPQWTGGMAFAEFRTIILGIGAQDLEWGLDAVEHELAHVIVGNLVSACYSRLPTWLSEGLAMVAEGGLDPESQAMLDQALADDTFYPVRALTDSFTEDPSGASLAYAQSYSLVTFLLEQYGRERLLDLLAASQAGSSPDSALTEVYGFDTEGLEQAWRAWIGAPALPSPGTSVKATPTVMPTYQPLAGAPLAITATPIPYEPLPPRTATGIDDVIGQGLAFVGFACACLTVGIILVVIVLVLVQRRRRRTQPSGGDHA
jgi:Peptidase MA superfamily